MSYYKWLDGRASCNGGDARWRKGAWKTVKGHLEPCVNGLHLCRPEHLLSWVGPSLWLAEADESELIDHDNKIVVRRARIVEQLDWDARVARLFAADCAERVLPLFEKERPNDSRPRDAIAAARAFANGEIGDAAWAAARAAARAAAWDAAGAAAWAAARVAARAAARAAAWDAEREWQTARLLDYAHGRTGG